MAIALCPSFAFSQVGFERYQVEDGLTQNSILALLQDGSGYIWIGTEDGLNRFDGYSFKRFFQHGNDSVGLYNDYIWSLLEAKDGKIWIGHSNGISYFDPVSGTFKNVVIDENLLIISSYEDSSGNLWFGSAGKGLLRLNPSGEEVSRLVNHSPPVAPFDREGWALASNNILCITGLKGKIIMGTRGAGLFEVKDGKIQRYAEGKLEPFLATNEIWSILSNDEGKVFLGTAKGLGIANIDFSNLKIFNRKNTEGALGFDRIARLCFDKKDGLWVATYGGGLHHFDFRTGRFWNSRHNEADPRGLANDLAFTLLMDRNDNLWVGTWSGGLHKMSKYAPYIQTRKATSGLADYVLGMDVAHDSVFVAAYADGVFFGRGTEAPLPEGAPVFYALPTPPGIYVLDVDLGARYLWMALDGQGVLYTDKKLLKNPSWKSIRRIKGNPNSLNNHLVDAIKEDGHGTLWIGTRGSGLKRFFYQQPYGAPGSMHQYNFREGEPHSLSDNYILDIELDKKGYLWVGTANGLNRSYFPVRQDTLMDRFVRYGQGRINTIAISPAGTPYVGTGNGLYKIENENWVGVDGLGKEFVNSITWDHEGNRWVSTNSGVYAAPKGGALRHFSSKDGLQSNEFNSRSVALGNNGMVYFGGVKGLNIIDPQLLHAPVRPSKIVISSVTVNNQDEVGTSKEVVLDHNHRVVTFGFALLDFVNPEANRYAYRLEGFDEDWVPVGPDRRIATYTNLDPGEYTFFVKAVNSEGAGSDGLASIRLVNLPPPWKTWWAYAGYLLMLGTVVFIVLRAIVLRQRMKTKLALDRVELRKLKELDEFKSSFFANISHEFRTPLTLILGQLDEMERKGGGNPLIPSIRNNSKAVLNLVNQLLDLSRVDSGKFALHLATVPAHGFFARLLEPFEVLAHQKKLGFEASLPDEGEIILTDPAILEKVVNNLVSNAIKYNQPGGKVAFSARVSGKTLHMEILDTGIGIEGKDLPFIFDRFYRVEDVAEGTGIGLALAKELVQVHKGSIKVESRKGEVHGLGLNCPVAWRAFLTTCGQRKPWPH